VLLLDAASVINLRGADLFASKFWLLPRALRAFCALPTPVPVCALTGRPSTRQFFTVWNFIILVLFFALGTGLSFSCCRDVAMLRETPSASHRLAAAAHHLMLEILLPMSAMITAVVWLVLYPYDLYDRSFPTFMLAKYTNLTSLTMHGANAVFMLIEFALDALHVTPGHFGLVLGWGMLYALFNGLQAHWTHDTVYFFMDFTLAKTPFVAVGLICLLMAFFGLACLLSRLKWRLLLGKGHPQDPHLGDAVTPFCGGGDDESGAAEDDASEGASPLPPPTSIPPWMRTASGAIAPAGDFSSVTPYVALVR
jgi:hypothetical protein